MTSVQQQHPNPQSHEPRPQTRRRQKPNPNPNDPFLHLDNASPFQPSGDQDSPEPLINRILITPLLFTSFLLSLFLVNRRDRRRRIASSPPNIPPTWTSKIPIPIPILAALSPSTWLWDSPEPYQDGARPPTQTQTSAPSAPSSLDVPPPPPDATAHEATPPRHGRRAKQDGRWHLHRKIRDISRLEVGDALKIRGRVMAGMVLGMAVLVFGLGWGVRWVVLRVSGAVG